MNLARVYQDPLLSASAASLQYVTPEGPGFRRSRKGRRFRYETTEGTTVTDRKTLERIKRLVIPPAWADVWISAFENAHLWAVGRDARGRRQYHYHAKWRVVRDLAKYHHLAEFGRALPRIRRRLRKDLARRGLPREKVLAAAVRLLEETFVRIGNEEYARDNGSFGLTTLRDRHVRANGRALHLEFVGKGGKKHCVGIEDPQLARIVKRCREIPGYQLFQYIDEDDNRQSIGSSDVNAYLREIAGREFTAKDFRTWAGTLLAAVNLCDREAFKSESEAKRNVVDAIDAVAAQLNNTRSVCRKNYVHPEILDAYVEGELTPDVPRGNGTRPPRGLRTAEGALLAFLEKRLRKNAKDAQAAALAA
ncbi:MAG TPA: DNA topoisomerase IB [Dehalococcoidia bacterium]|nr:DNA topoisomerase IB [Dehalococcoidia bacterium]